MLNWLKAIYEVLIGLVVLIAIVVIIAMVFLLLTFALVFVVDYFQAENLMPTVFLTLVGIGVFTWLLGSVIEAHDEITKK